MQETKISRRQFLWRAFGAGVAVPSLAKYSESSASDHPDQAEVVIIGAGLAGLVAAYKLCQSFKSVVVLEASGVPGGRVRTIRNFDEGLYAEAGAARISGSHLTILKYIKELGLTTTAFSPADSDTLLVSGASRFGSSEPCDQTNPYLKLGKAERGLTASELLQHYTAGVIEKLNDPALHPAMFKEWKQYDELTWIQWLHRQGASEDAIRLMTLGGDSHTLSALYVLRQIALHNTSHHYYKIVGGMDLLPTKLAARLSNPIRYNSIVTSLKQDADGVDVDYTTNEHKSVIRAKYVVCAVPLPLLNRLEIYPKLSASKQLAMKEISYFEGTRFLIQTRSRFWERTGLSGFARTDGPAEIWNASFGQSGTRGILATTIGGAMHKSMMDITSAAFPDIQSESEKVMTFRWKEEPLARGAFIAFGPNQMSKFSATLPQQEGRIYFAGEHTSPWMSWMEGAAQSGERVADEILHTHKELRPIKPLQL